ncbi:MAG: GNAT family N-acetyltransferase, partial [Chloroflexi bacterium]|nr:GNAT family N-acetyltransferase [Chloroflexota bacterium]
AVAESNVALQALIGSGQAIAGPGILVPAINHALLSWCLANRLRVVQLMNLMSVGLYSEPNGAWLPSVLY